MGRVSHHRKAISAVQRVAGEAAKEGRLAERAWWRQQLAKLVLEAESLHGPGAVISASQIVGLSHKRGGEDE